MPLPTRAGMWLYTIYLDRSDNIPHYRFVGYKRTTAIDILALAVTLFCGISDLKTAPGMSCMSTLWANHHSYYSITTCFLHNDTFKYKIENHLFYFEIINFYFQLHTGRKSIIRADRMRQGGNGPFCIINRLLKSRHLHRHFRIEISPPLSELQGK